MKNTYFKVLLILVVLIFGTIATSKGQALHDHSETYESSGTKRVIINTKDSDILKRLQSKGIDFMCGSTGVPSGIQVDLNLEEVHLLEVLQVPYTVTIENLSQFISERNTAKMPEARTQLSQLKSLSKGMKPVPLVDAGNNNKSFSQSSESIPSPIQYDECAEIDWTPQNFEFGSMGGAYNYQEILDELARMQTLYPNIISVVKDASPSGQKTHGYTGTNPDIAPQTMWYVKISDNPDTDEMGEPQSLITGAAHAREVSSVMNIIYYMWYILENYNSDPLITSMINHQELYFIPVINPDGYIYNGIQAPNGGGNQRKNLRPGTGTGQYTQGVDLNRNSPYYWGADDAGSSPTVTAGTYRGPSPGSEPETQIIADFIDAKDIKLAINHHSGLNSIVTSSYNGDTNAAPSGREDEFQELMQNVTHYNRYIHGSAPNTLYEANGDFNDWMLGGPPVTTNPSGGGSFTNSGSGKNIIAFTPENGDEFTPDPTHIIPIAKRALRMNLITSLSAGKYAQLHDLTNSDISGASPTLDFAVEYIGQTLDDLTLTVTPISTNIDAITPLPATALNGMSKLEQRYVSLPISVSPGTPANALLEYEVTLSNSDYDIYKAVYRKYYDPMVLIDADGIANWTGNWVNYSNGYNGSTNAISVITSGAYGNNIVRTTTLNTPQDLDGSNGYMIQFNAFWDIERNFDLVQLEASTDGTNWTALCGKYNKPVATTPVNNHFNTSKGGPGNPSNHQEVNGTYIYDGDQIVGGVNKWVMEEIFIDFENNTQFLGETGVQFRFRFDSDVSNLQDGYNTDFAGFIFDDFKILALDGYTRELCDEIPVNTYPYSESFENGFGNWSQDQGDDGEWSRISGATPSGPTGPTSANDGSFYLYTEATEDGNAPGENLGNNATAILTGPCFDLANASSATLNFDYHMFGANMGTLKVEVLDDDTFTWTPIFTQTGATGTAQGTWSSESAALTPYLNKTIKIRFVGTTGNGFESDMAIDNIELIAAIEDPDTVPPTAICQDVTASLGADGTVTILASQVDNGSTDDGTITSITLDVDTFDCSNVGVNNVVLTVTDAGDNTDTCTATVTIEPYTTAPDGLSATAVEATSATLSWNVAASNEYNLRFRESGTTTWTDNILTSNSIDLTGLDPETTFEAQVRANCSTGNTPYSTLVTFTTASISYCDANGNNVDDEYIGNVTLNDGTSDLIDNTTAGSAGGYGNFTSQSASLRQGSTFSISITKVWTTTQYNEAIGVWIDYNRDGDFSDDGEQIVAEPANQITPVITSNIIVPMTVTLGATRMRVVLKYVGGGDTEAPASCGSFAFGEVEDYTIDILSAVTEYVYDSGSWSPSDPSGIATDIDNITVLSGVGPLTTDTTVNNVTVQNGATLSLGTTTLSFDGDFTNTGAVAVTNAGLVITGDTAQNISGNPFTLGSLTLNNAAGATLNADIKIKELLTLTTGELVTNGNLTLGSDMNGSAMVAPITGGSISGDVTTEQYIPAKRAFRLIGSTVTTSSSIRANWQEGGNSPIGFGTHITGSTDGSNGFDATSSGNYSLFTLNNPGQSWEAVSNTDVNTLTAGRPMRLLVRGDRNIDLSSNASPANATTLRTTGELATGNVTTLPTSLNHTINSFNFIGNPYQATVNVNSVLNNSTNINANQIFVWDATLGARGQYVTVTLDGTGSSNGTLDPNKAYHFVQPGQAIFTRTLATVGDNSTQVLFSETDKVIGENVDIYGFQSDNNETTAHIIGRLFRTESYGTNEGLQDNFVVRFNELNDNEITPADAPKFFNIDENMAISNDDTLLSVEHRMMPQEGEELQLFNALYRTSEYSLDIEVAGLTEVTAYFVDTFEQTTTALSNGVNHLTFTVDTSNDESQASDRFKIVYETTALVINDTQNVDFSLYPNPVKDGVIHIKSSSFAGRDVQVTLNTILGQKVVDTDMTFSDNTLSINLNNNLQSGVYLLTVKTETTQFTQRVIVE